MQSENAETQSNDAAEPGSPPGGLSARGAALRILSDLREGHRTARESIDDLVAGTRLAPQELGLTTELVMGVVRHRLTLTKVLGRYTTRGWQRVSRQLQHILMIGAYQLLWLDSVPAFAAVNEAVIQSKSEGGVPAAHFVNAVLRQLLRDIENQRISLDKADSMRTIPINADVGCQLRKAVFSDPASNPVAHLAEISSHPTWLVGRWVSHFGRAATESICYYGMQRPAVLLRPNRLRTDAQTLKARLHAEGYPAELTPTGTLAISGTAAGLMRSRCFEEGLFQPQDPTAMKAIQQMKLSPGQVVLDLCAGVGTKTSQMAEFMHNRGTVLASDNQPAKLQMLETNCRRLGVAIARIIPADELESAVGELDQLDWILIDAPCSNTGVLARRPEARYRADRKAIESLATIQSGLMDQASRLARPGTRLLYSTCSLEPEENEGVATAFAEAHPTWRLIDSELTLPTAQDSPATWHDGGYWAVWSR